MQKTPFTTFSLIKLLIPLFLLSNCSDFSWAQVNRKEFKSVKNAFVAKFNGEPKFTTNVIPNDLEPDGPPYKIDKFTFSGLFANNFELITVLDLPLGYYHDHESDIHNELIVELEQQGSITSNIDTLFLEGYEGRQFQFLLNDGTPVNYMFFYRGNRLYRVISSGESTGLQPIEIDPFLRSFRFISFQKSELKNFTFEEDEFSVDLFGEPFIQKDNSYISESELGESSIYSTADPNSGGTYIFQIAEFNDYFRMQNADTFLFNYADRLLEWNEEILEKRPLDINGKKALEFTTQRSSKHGKTRYFILLDEDRLVLLYSVVPFEKFEKCSTERIFNSFISLRPKSTKELYSSKAQLIINDLASSDTSIYNGAIGTFNYYSWQEDEREILIKAFNKTYPSDTSSTGAKYSLIDALSSFDDVKAVNQLKSVYEDPETPEDLKEYILSTLTTFEKEHYLKTYIDLLFTDPPKQKEIEYWSLFDPFQEDLDLASDHLEGFAELLKKGYYHVSILRILNSIAKKEKTHHEFLVNNYSLFIQDAFDDLKEFNKLTENDEYADPDLVMNYLDFLRIVRNDIFAKQYTPLFSTLELDWPKTEAMAIRILYGLPNQKEHVIDKLKDPYTRYDLIKAHYIAGKLEEVPRKYLKPHGLARTIMNEYVYENDDLPDDLILQGDIEENDSIYYAISIIYEWDDSSYLGLCGPFPKDGSFPKLENVKAYTDWESVKDDWKNQALEMIPGLRENGFIEYDPYW